MRCSRPDSLSRDSLSRNSLSRDSLSRENLNPVVRVGSLSQDNQAASRGSQAANLDNREVKARLLQGRRSREVLNRDNLMSQVPESRLQFLAIWHRRLRRPRSNFRTLSGRWPRRRVQLSPDSLARRLRDSRLDNQHPGRAGNRAKGNRLPKVNQDKVDLNLAKVNPAANQVSPAKASREDLNRAKDSLARELRAKANLDQDSRGKDSQARDSPVNPGSPVKGNRLLVRQIPGNPVPDSRARVVRGRARWRRRLSHFGRRRRCSTRRLSNSTRISQVASLNRVN